MADNQILVPLQISGLTGLTLQIVSAPGNTVPSPLAVSEIPGDPGLYLATFTGLGTEENPIAYSGILRKDGALTGIATPTFLWDGTDFVYVGLDSGQDTKLTELWQRASLDADNPVTRESDGEDVTETFGAVTITHNSNGTDSVTSTRS
jgi:hypothetical protein